MSHIELRSNSPLPPAGDQVRVVNHNKTNDWSEVENKQGQVGWVPTNHIAPVNSLDKFSW